jgi:hypothetical protein
MRAPVAMIGVGLLSWAGVAAATGGRANPEVLYGMLGPLTVAVASWLVVQRVYATNPVGVIGVLLAGMAIKLIFLATYTFVMLRVLDVRPIPFVASFTCYFIALHHIEALFMRRLFTSEC